MTAIEIAINIIWFTHAKNTFISMFMVAKRTNQCHYRVWKIVTKIIGHSHF